ncbi:hypothetical protein A2841_01850 [Candidatus Kaiserbacteria bacterium RIFCSPHIGHO2_01_FULL_48_10]|uniref:Uncharacterized protein n=1 Tax=Candidatus Kaiserbacteria bacterium RIFCSPHIGHO2_01_FULL_48_10 TaxID=1798476 RepID=A0A1F6C5G2_9BACT|nr:MAG: hypothetical protein A2841_01850 [Candidatus Kaiserbacteria bacterium RIFCSPHIGHO2_01_FULL_48_10]
MDYTSDPSSNQHPNVHDFEQLETIYGHVDSSTTVGAAINTLRGLANTLSTPEEQGDSEWGKAVHFDASGRPNVFEKDLRAGEKVITHVFWVE